MMMIDEFEDSLSKSSLQKITSTMRKEVPEPDFKKPVEAYGLVSKGLMP